LGLACRASSACDWDDDLGGCHAAQRGLLPVRLEQTRFDRHGCEAGVNRRKPAVRRQARRCTEPWSGVIVHLGGRTRETATNARQHRDRARQRCDRRAWSWCRDRGRRRHCQPGAAIPVDAVFEIRFPPPRSSRAGSHRHGGVWAGRARSWSRPSGPGPARPPSLPDHLRPISQRDYHHNRFGRGRPVQLLSIPRLLERRPAAGTGCG